jgi:hypothetical protein
LALYYSLRVFTTTLFVLGVAEDGTEQTMTQPPDRRRLSWPRGHKRLTAGLAALGVLLVIGACGNATGSGKSAVKVADLGTRSTMTSAKAGAKADAKAGAKAGPKAAATASLRAAAKAGGKASPKAGPKPSANPTTAAKPEASQDCPAQVRAWLNGGSTQQLTALEDGFTALDAAGHAFEAAAADGAASAGDVSAVQTAADALQSDAGAIEANPGPTCVPGLRANLMSGASDYSQVAIDANSGMDQYEAGQVSAAIADVEAARPLVAEGSAGISAAAKAAGNFSG